MIIKSNQGQEAQVFDTPEGISYFQLCSVKAAMKLEAAGMKSRFGALRPIWAPKLGLKPRDSYEKFIAELERRIEEILDKRANQDSTNQGNTNQNRTDES